jgi:hypothetical protein
MPTSMAWASASHLLKRELCPLAVRETGCGGGGLSSELPSRRPKTVVSHPRPSRGDRWNILADIEVFIFAVEAELEAMDHEWAGLHRRGRKPDLTRRRRLIRLISRYAPTGRGTGTLDLLLER